MAFTRNRATSMATATWAPRAHGGRGGLKSKLLEIIPRLRTWTLSSRSYEELPDIEATWFIDPPYNNPAGGKYAVNDIDYQHLAEWCRSRRGQIIVCENAGADWL